MQNNTRNNVLVSIACESMEISNAIFFSRIVQIYCRLSVYKFITEQKKTVWFENIFKCFIKDFQLFKWKEWTGKNVLIHSLVVQRDQFILK